MHWRRKWQPTPGFLPGESQGRGAWRAAVYGVTQSQIRLKRLSSSSSSSRAFTVIPFMDMCMLNVAKKVIYLPHEHVLSWGQIRFLSDILFHLSYCKMCSFHALFSATFSTFLFFSFSWQFFHLKWPQSPVLQFCPVFLAARRLHYVLWEIGMLVKFHSFMRYHVVFQEFNINESMF